MKILNKLFAGDLSIWIVVFFLIAISVLMIYSAMQTKIFLDYYNFFIQHILILAFGIIILLFMKFIKLSGLKKLAIWFLGLSVLLILYMLIFTQSGKWSIIPFFWGIFDTSYLIIISVIILLSKILSEKKEFFESRNKWIVLLCVVIGIVVCLLLLINIIKAIVLAITCFIVLIFSRFRIKHILMYMIITGLIVVFFSCIIITRIQNKEVRYINYLEYFQKDKGEKNYLSSQLKKTIASGIPFGKGPGNSANSNLLPYAYSHYVYAIIIEEYGIAAGVIVVFLYLLLFYRAIVLAIKRKGTFSSLLLIGFSSLIIIQVLLHILTTLSVIPVTGQSLPLISIDPPSIVFTLLIFGIILFASTNREELEYENNI